MKKPPTVFVAQHTLVKDPIDPKKFIPKFSISAAEEYGQIEFLIEPYASAFQSSKIIPAIVEKLKCYTDEDFILPVGNPSMIGWVVGIASQQNDGRVQTLQWNAYKKSYDVVIAQLF